MLKLYRIYKIDLPDGRSYVGCTTNSIERRIAEHWSAGRRGGTERHNYEGVGAAIFHFGVDRLRYAELATTRDAQMAAEIETALIAQHRTMAPHGYNMRAASCIKRGVANGTGTSLQRRKAA